MNKSTATGLMATALLVMSPCAMAWGDMGHEAIASLAWSRLNTEARQSIEAILPGESLADISLWADYMRARHSNDSRFWGYEHSANWHFVNIPPEADYDPLHAAPEGDIVMAINTFADILQGIPATSGPVYEGLLQYRSEFPEQPDPMTDKALALYFLVHLIADIHQPLHVGYGADRGGNDIDVDWYEYKTNLHSVWDTQMVRSLAPNSEALLEKLDRELDRVSPEAISRVADSTTADWLAEGLRIRAVVYDSATDGSYLANRYAAAYADTSRSQLLKAAIRTASTLNRIFETSE